MLNIYIIIATMSSTVCKVKRLIILTHTCYIINISIQSDHTKIQVLVTFTTSNKLFQVDNFILTNS